MTQHQSIFLGTKMETTHYSDMGVLPDTKNCGSCMRRECRERVSQPDMHHDTCVRHVSWCMPGSLTSGFLWSQWRGKCSRHSRMRNPQFYVSGKRLMAWVSWRLQSPTTQLFVCLLSFSQWGSVYYFLIEIDWLIDWIFLTKYMQIINEISNGTIFLDYTYKIPLKPSGYIYTYITACAQ